MGSTPLEYCWFIYKIGGRTGRLTGQFETYAHIDPRPFCGSHPPRVGPQSLQGVVAISPLASHPGPDSRPFRPFPSHLFEARSTSLLGVEILRWGAGRVSCFDQQRRQLKS